MCLSLDTIKELLEKKLSQIREILAYTYGSLKLHCFASSTHTSIISERPIMFRILYLPVFTLTIASCFCAVSHGDLVLNVNTTSEQFFFTGSTTGDPTTFFINGGTGGPEGSFVSWGGRVSSETFDLSNALNHNAPGTRHDLTLGFDELSPANILDIRLLVTHNAVNASPVTYSGTGPDNAVSYATISTTRKAFLENQIGNSLSLGSGGGFSDVRIVAATVPEPSSTAIMGIGMAILTGRRRRNPVGT